MNDLYEALEEIQDLEAKGLLSNPPPSTSAIAKREIELCHNSAGLIEYIKDNERTACQLESKMTIYAALFLVILIIRIFYKRIWKTLSRINPKNLKKA